MELTKAIKILEHKVKQNVFQVDPDAFTALKLGIEALRRYEDLRKYNVLPHWEKLPGETPPEKDK